MKTDSLLPLLPEIAAECSARYPAEACGLLIADAQGSVKFVAIQNIAGSAAAAGTSARTGRDGYVMDPGRLSAELDAADSAGATLAGIVHSHPDVGAYFSREDREQALGGGDSPLWPGVDYLVISCRAGACDDARIYRWDFAARDFLEETLAISRQPFGPP